MSKLCAAAHYSGLGFVQYDSQLTTVFQTIELKKRFEDEITG